MGFQMDLVRGSCVPDNSRVDCASVSIFNELADLDAKPATCAALDEMKAERAEMAQLKEMTLLGLRSAVSSSSSSAASGRRRKKTKSGTKRTKRKDTKPQEKVPKHP